MIRILFIFTLLLTTAVTVNATDVPGNGIIYVSGTVSDKNSNESLAGVEVRVQGTDIVTYTDFDGNYFLPELKAGSYTLEFKLTTYSSATFITTGENRENQVDVELQQR